MRKQLVVVRVTVKVNKFLEQFQIITNITEKAKEDKHKQESREPTDWVIGEGLSGKCHLSRDLAAKKLWGSMRTERCRERENSSRRIPRWCPRSPETGAFPWGVVSCVQCCVEVEYDETLCLLDLPVWRLLILII